MDKQYEGQQMAGSSIVRGEQFVNLGNQCAQATLAQPQPGLSMLLQQQEGMLAGLSKELAELEDMLEHLRYHSIPVNPSAKEQAEPSTSSLGGMIQRNNVVIASLAGRLDYLKNTLRGML